MGNKDNIAQGGKMERGWGDRMQSANMEFILDGEADSVIPKKSGAGLEHWLLRDQTPQLCLFSDE